MAGKSQKRFLVFTDHRLDAVTAILGAQHSLTLYLIPIAIGPAVIAAVGGPVKLLGRQDRALGRGIDFGP